MNKIVQIVAASLLLILPYVQGHIRSNSVDLRLSVDGRTVFNLKKELDKLLHKHNFLNYEDARNAIIEAEDTLAIGGKVVLTPKEKIVNKMLIRQKSFELSNGLRNPSANPSQMHFFKAKPLIEKSKVFRFIKKMPKGALLHAHNTAQVSSEWVISNLTYTPGLMRCVNAKGVSVLSFRKSSSHKCVTRYVNVCDERKNAYSVKEYDRELEKLINLYTPAPEIDYPTVSMVWEKFQGMFATVTDMISYVPAFRAYHWRMLEEMYEDGVMYAELRMSFRPMYDERGRIYDSLQVAKELTKLVRDFQKSHHGFLGLKAIYSTQRKVEHSTVQEKLNHFKKLHSALPNLIIGFDLVGQEDTGNPLHNFVNILRKLPPDTRYFFHAGETNWYGTSTDFNLLDAILLNTSRIGHGYALMKHPVLLNTVVKRDIAIEVNPISNQVLNLVWDLRNHPASYFMSENIPMVISNDDPGFWNAKGLSYDFYYALMSFASGHAGLKTMKQLVWNSLKYSDLNGDERRRAFRILQRQWDRFLDDVVTGYVI